MQMIVDEEDEEEAETVEKEEAGDGDDLLISPQSVVYSVLGVLEGECES